MTQAPLTIAAFRAAAGASRLSAGLGICAYPWAMDVNAADRSQLRTDVTAEPKHRFRWPGDPSS